MPKQCASWPVSSTGFKTKTACGLSMPCCHRSRGSWSSRPCRPWPGRWQKSARKRGGPGRRRGCRQLRGSSCSVMAQARTRSRKAERCQVVLHVDVNTLREQKSGLCCTHGHAHFEDKPWLAPSTARRHRGCFDICLNGVSAEIFSPQDVGGPASRSRDVWSMGTPK